MIEKTGVIGGRALKKKKKLTLVWPAFTVFVSVFYVYKTVY